MKNPNEIKYKHVFNDRIHLSGLTVPAVKGVFNQLFKNKQFCQNWAEYCQYLHWEVRQGSFIITPTNQIASQRKIFATSDDFVDFLATIIPLDALSQFEEDAIVDAYEAITPKDEFPRYRIVRNSLVASILGRKRWNNQFQYSTRAGVAPQFNAGMWYLNMLNDLGRNLVVADGIGGPATNEDRIIWKPRRMRSRDSVMNTHSLDLGTVGQGGRWVYDSGTNSYVPAPTGSYFPQRPLYLCEQNHNRILSIDSVENSSARKHDLRENCACLIPVRNGTYTAYVVYPNGFDTFWTDYYDPTEYKVFLRLKLRGEFRDRYVFIAPRQNDQQQETMHVFWDLATGVNKVFRNYLNPQNALDDSVIPVRIDVCRRSMHKPYARSPWVPLAKVQRRTPQTAAKLVPIYKR